MLPRTTRIVFVAICAAIFLGAVDLTIVTAVLPRILVDLNVSIDTDLGRAAWVITGYLLAYTIGMAFAGRLSDLYGRRVCYTIGLIVFIVGSLGVALAPSLELVIFGRIIQALGAGALVPVAMALTGDLFPQASRAQALGIIAAVDTAGWMVGHLYGGALMQLFDNWRLLFWLNIPFGLLALALTVRALRHMPVVRGPGSFDWPGAFLLAGALAALNIGLGGGAELGTTDFYGERSGPPAYAIPLIIVSLGLFAGFGWVERRTRDPLVDIGLFVSRRSAAASCLNLLLGFALAIALTNVPLFVNARIGLLGPGDPDALRRGAWESGLLLSALTLTMALAAWPGGRMAGRLGAHVPALVGMALGVAGFLLTSRWRADVGYLEMAFGLGLAGSGLGLVLAPAADCLIGATSEQRRGATAALAIVLRLIGMTLGVSALTAWGVQRQDVLRRLGATNPQVATDPAGFLIAVAAQVVSEGFLFAVAACVLGMVVAWWVREYSGARSQESE
ncbi:MAG: MFS transporter [Roseiflexaceae bacterium]|nr:MFS transporter [Roseiflexaceae bacterium]